MNGLTIEPLEQRIINHKLGMHSFVKRNPRVMPSFLGVIDMSLLPPDIGTAADYSSLDQIRGQGEDLYAEVDGNIRDSALVRQGLAGGIILARVLNGEKIPFKDHYEIMTGVKAELVPKADIKAASKKVDDLLGQQGLEHSAAGHKEFMDRFGIKGTRTIRQAVNSEVDRSLRLLKEYVGYELADTRITVKWLNDQWAAFLEYKHGKGFNVLVNANTDMFPQTVGRAAEQAYHEVPGHAVQFSIWRDGFLAGEISPVLGLIDVHSPAMTQFEGLGHWAMRHFLSKGPWIHQYHAANDELRLMVLHNGHMSVAMGLMDVDEATDMVASLMPFEPRETIRGFMKNARDDAQWKVYGGCNYPGFKMHKPLVGASDEKLKEVLPKIYGRPTLPEQFSELVAA